MNIESYAKQPLDVEVFQIGEYTDIILRRNITETMSEGQETQAVWRCEEVQRRVSGAVTLEQAREQFDALWDSAEEEVQADSVEARVADLEAAFDLLLSGATV